MYCWYHWVNCLYVTKKCVIIISFLFFSFLLSFVLCFIFLRKFYEQNGCMNTLETLLYPQRICYVYSFPYFTDGMSWGPPCQCSCLQPTKNCNYVMKIDRRFPRHRSFKLPFVVIPRWLSHRPLKQGYIFPAPIICSSEAHHLEFR